MIIATGRTFEHRDQLRLLGGTWNGEAKRWEFFYLTDEQRTIIAGLVGVSLTTSFRPKLSIRKQPVRIGDDFTYYNHFRDKNPLVFAGFSSLAKFVDHVASLEPPPNHSGTCDIGWTAEPGYAGSRSMVEALYIARTGWPDGLGLASRLLPPDPLMKRRQRTVAGGSVSVGRLLAGAPNHMTKRVKIKGRKIITIFVENVKWEGITIDTALVRVVAIAAIIDRLEQRGYSCNIIAIYSAKNRDGTDDFHLTVNLKEPGEALNISDISFAFGHPSFGRRLVYAHHGVIPQCDYRREQRGRISEAFNDQYRPAHNEFYIPQIFRNTTDIRAVMDQIMPDNLPIKITIDEK